MLYFFQRVNRYLAILVLFLFLHFQPDLHVLKSTHNPLKRLFICIPSYAAPSATRASPFLVRNLQNLHRDFAPLFAVNVSIDTNSAAVAEHISQLALSSLSISVRVWTLNDVGGSFTNLAGMHRRSFFSAVDSYDTFLYLEDDAYVPIAAFLLYLERQEELWRYGWLYSWVRAEVWWKDNVTLVASDIWDFAKDPPIYISPRGFPYAVPLNSYAASYALDAAQLRAFIDDQSGIFFNGMPNVAGMERFSIGYFGTFVGGTSLYFGPSSGNRGWKERGLVPMTSANGEGSTVDSRAIIFHMSQKYAAPRLWPDVPVAKWGEPGDLVIMRVKDLFQWSAGHTSEKRFLHSNPEACVWTIPCCGSTSVGEPAFGGQNGQPIQFQKPSWAYPLPDLNQ